MWVYLHLSMLKKFAKSSIYSVSVQNVNDVEVEPYQIAMQGMLIMMLADPLESLQRVVLS